MLQENLISSLSFYPLSSLVPCTIKCADGVQLYHVFHDYCEYTWGGFIRNTYMPPSVFKKAIRDCLDTEEFNLAAPEIETLMQEIESLEDKRLYVALDK